jgi:hypothetical protein
MAYDSRCLELAEHFAPDKTAEKKADLAQRIQDAVEDWFLMNEPVHYDQR